MSTLLAFASNYGSSYGSSMDIEDILGLFGGMLCLYLIPGLISIALVIWAAHMAQQKERSAAAWVALTLFFGIIPFIVLCCLPSLASTKTWGPKSAPAWGQPSQGGQTSGQTWSAPTTPKAPTTSATPAPVKTGIVVTCPHCQGKMKVSEQSADKKVRCPACHNVITLKAGVVQPIVPAKEE